jgi:hypothetical protein
MLYQLSYTPAGGGASRGKRLRYQAIVIPVAAKPCRWQKAETSCPQGPIPPHEIPAFAGMTDSC